jgi:O-methyltransferase
MPFSMAGRARLEATLDAVAYCVRRGIPGAFAECGVWRGGSVLAMILKLQQLGCHDRDIYLFDTFEGMTAPTEADVSAFSRPALETWNRARAAGRKAWDYFFGAETFNEDAVRSLLTGTGYPGPRLHFVRGAVEETLPAAAPAQIALLRLDTDWYESTRHELVHLYPRLAQGGVLLIDDYGHWQGCRRAVDEYFASGEVAPVLLHRVDYTGRTAIKH